MEGEDLGQPLGERLQHRSELGDRSLGPRVNECFDPCPRVGLVVGVVDLVELLQELPRSPQLGVLGQRERKASELLRGKMLGARELQLAGPKNDRREHRRPARLADALDPPSDLDEPVGEPPDDVKAVDDVGRVTEMTIDRGLV